MLTPIVLVFGLLLATAYIAYWSDNLGKKLGKKRVTFYKLRPRDTATLFTIVSSEGIMIFTVLVLLLIYSPLRNALFTYDKVRAENHRLQDDNARLQSESGSLQAAALRSEGNLVAEQRQVVLTQGKLVNSRQDLTRVSASLIQAQNGELEARRQQAAAKKGEAAAEALAANAHADLIGAQNGLQVVEFKYSAAAAELKARQDELEAAQGQLLRTGTQLGKLKAQLASAHSDLAATQSNLTQARAEYERASKSAFAATARELEAESKAEAAAKVAEEASNTAQRVRAEAQNMLLLAFNDVRVPVNQVLAARMVPEHCSVADVRTILADMVTEGQSVVPTLLDGAQIDVMLAPGSVPAVPDDDGPILDKLAASIADHDEQVSLRLVAARNYLSGEKFVDGFFEGVVSRQAFKQGDTIAQAELDGRETDAQVFSGLNRLLDLGRQQAVLQNVTPPFSPASPNFYSAGTNERMFEALRNVEALKRPTTVKLVAAADLTTVDPLDVRFEVE